jgi:predicted phage terminase large subunit-like protein
LRQRGQRDDAETSALREQCATDLRRFALAFFPHLCTDPFSDMHQEFFDAHQATRRGLKRVTAAPRGHAKTSLKGFIEIIHDCVYGQEQYILIISSRSEMATDKVKQIRDELETNARLIEVYGEQVGEVWNQSDFITAGRTRVRAASPRTQVRGLLWHGYRPTKVLLDDAEDSEHVQTTGQREKFEHWYTSDIAKIGSKSTNFEVIGTVLHPESLVARLLDNPGYDGRRYQAVLRFADQAPELWQQWRALFCNLDDPERVATAEAFYAAHQEVMTAGAVVLWPEHESYYDLMVQRLVDGDTAFFMEKQNEPLASTRFPFRMQQAGLFSVAPDAVRRSDGIMVPLADLLDLTAFYDPALGEGRNPDWSACVLVAKDLHGYVYVLDAVLEHFAPPSEMIEQIATLLARWRVPRIGLESNNFQSLLTDDLRQAIAREQQQADFPCQIIPVRNTRAKHLRILALEALIANRWLWFNDRLPAEFFRQMTEFRPLPDAGKDDGPDALESAIRLQRWQVDKGSPY